MSILSFFQDDILIAPTLKSILIQKVKNKQTAPERYNMIRYYRCLHSKEDHLHHCGRNTIHCSLGKNWNNVGFGRRATFTAWNSLEERHISMSTAAVSMVERLAPGQQYFCCKRFPKCHCKTAPLLLQSCSVEAGDSIAEGTENPIQFLVWTLVWTLVCLNF